ncbi:acyltransferase family protein [uncultured Chitinophaga sp.]|uniref:acyltransferase family protein n=1 Tax=uncultured Chitinophaga sp. TaxID=339340 RepID=UPI0025D0C57E|nr:acyltransferase family protein [uncultured Chitinophaga sp.]
MYTSTSRRYDLDWLRVIAIIGVLFYHVSMIFAMEENWHIKNKDQSYLFLEFNFWLSRFRMPLLFFISGVGVWYALKRRSGGQFMKERALRLLLPLVAGMLLIVPPQVYIERLSQGQPYPSYFDFYPSIFEFRPYPEGNTSWHHLWFILYLFIYAAAGLPLFLWLKRAGSITQRLRWFAKGANILWLIVPTILLYTWLRPGNPQTNDLLHDYAFLPYWFTFFIVGYIVAVTPGLWDSIERNRRLFLAAAFISLIVLNYLRWNGREPWDVLGDDWQDHPVSRLYYALYPIVGWSWVLTALGYGKRYLNRPHPALEYANRGIYPFYILHQTVIVIIGYYVIATNDGILEKYLFISFVSLVLSVLVYHVFIRPFAVMRFIFGVKEDKKEQQKNRKLNETAEHETIAAI